MKPEKDELMEEVNKKINEMSRAPEVQSKGISRGIEQKSRKIAKKLLSKNMNIEEISEITGLTKEEIEDLK